MATQSEQERSDAARSVGAALDLGWLRDVLGGADLAAGALRMKPLHAGGQADRILGHLASGKTLTPLQALQRFGTLRLSGRILELRQRGHDIRTDMVRRGQKRVARYWLQT